jgi:hypothetical protein
MFAKLINIVTIGMAIHNEHYIAKVVSRFREATRFPQRNSLPHFAIQIRPGGGTCETTDIAIRHVGDGQATLARFRESTHQVRRATIGGHYAR